LASSEATSIVVFWLVGWIKLPQTRADCQVKVKTVEVKTRTVEVIYIGSKTEGDKPPRGK
jgi:hypothetical protein